MGDKPGQLRAGRTAPDVGGVVAEEFPARSLPPVQGQRRPGFQVVARRSVLNDVYRHGHASPHVEVCGVLVGNVYRDEAGAFLYVEASIRGEHAGSQGAQVTFTPATWTHVQAEMDRCHAGQRVLGWYHTHPGFGIFLSGMDLFIQENFFSLPWQVAFVYDPVGGDEGLFVWRSGAPVREPFLVEEDAVSEKLATAPRLGGAPLTAEVDGRLQVLDRQQKWLLGGVAALALLVLIWPLVLGGFRAGSADNPARDWDEHLLTELGELRMKSRELGGEVARLQGEVARLRGEVARLHVTVEARLPPPEEHLPLPVVVQALLIGDVLPGPPRPLPGALLPAAALVVELSGTARPPRRGKMVPFPVAPPADND
jgi:proteasome lid subunit RPN8/RPN11